MAKRTPDIGEIPPPSREARLKVAKLRKLSWAFVVGIGGAAAVASGYKFTVAAGLLSVLVVTHGIGSYAAKLGGHKRHRDALMFVGAQDLSVLAALLLLAATGPGGLSVDAKYGKGN